MLYIGQGSRIAIGIDFSRKRRRSFKDVIKCMTANYQKGQILMIYQGNSLIRMPYAIRSISRSHSLPAIVLYRMTNTSFAYAEAVNLLIYRWV